MDETKPKTVWKKTFRTTDIFSGGTPEGDSAFYQSSNNDNSKDISNNDFQNPLLDFPKFPEPQLTKNTNSEPVPSNLQENPLETIYENSGYESNKKYYREYFNTLREGLTTIREGFDTSVCQSVGASIRPYIDYIHSWITWLFAWFEVIETNVGKHMANFFSSGPSSDNDKAVIKEEFQYFISVCFSCYIVYNWFYVCFFKRGEIDEEGKKKVEGTRITITDMESKHLMIDLIFKYLMVPISILNYTLMTLIPMGMDSIVYDRKLIFIILYVSIIFIVFNLGNNVRDMLLNGINMQSDSNSGYYTMLMMLRGGYDGFQSLLPPVEYTPMNIVKNVIKKYTLIPQFFSFLFRLVLSMTFVWFCSLIIAIYLYFKSFLCMYFDKEARIVPGDVMVEIEKFILSQRKKQKCYPCGDTNKLNDCNPLSFKMIFHWITEFIEKVYVKLYRYTFEISFIILFLNSILNYKSGISNINLKSALMIMCSIFIFVCLFIGFKRSYTIDEEAVIAKKAVEIAMRLAEATGKPIPVIPSNSCGDEAPKIVTGNYGENMFGSLLNKMTPPVPVEKIEPTCKL